MYERYVDMQSAFHEHRKDMSKGSKLHPFVQDFIDSKEHSWDLALKIPEPRSPILEAIFLLARARIGEVAPEKAFGAAEAVSLKNQDPTLALLFLRYWGHYSHVAQRHSELSMIINRMRPLANARTPVEIKAALLSLEGVARTNEGNVAGYLMKHKQAISILPPESPHVRRYLANHIASFVQTGMGVEAEQDLDRLESMCDETFTSGLAAHLRLMNLVETGHAEEALELLPQVQGDWMAMKYHRANIERYRVILELTLGQWQREKPDQAREEKEYLWALSTRALLAGRPEEALRYAREFVTAYPKVLIWMRGFTEFTMIRAELAAGNAQAARSFLDKRRQAGQKQYLDDFFLARVELMAGNEEVAARHFAAALKACEYYRAQPRLDFELRMACELSPPDVMRLTRGADQYIASGQPLISPQAPLPPAEPRVGIDRLVGQDKATQALRKTIEQIVPLDVPVLITGETGTGKELVARAIHEEGPRKDKEFLAVNCAAIAESLLQTELFGHAKGAFTGAEREHPGIFETAGKGTVLLDEIGDISPQLQVALLRVLETAEIRPVGSAKTRKVFCRIIAATNTVLEDLAEKGSFRKDLLFRLQRLEIRIPPLRERCDDIMPLAYHFLNENRPEGVRATLSAEAEQALRQYDWPGNVRELRNQIERMRLLNSDKLSYHVTDLTLTDSDEKSEKDPRISQHLTGEPPGEPVHPERVEEILRGTSKPLRRQDYLRKIFLQHKKLTRSQAAKILNVCVQTAARDLNTLCQEGFIQKVRPTASPRSNYFMLRGQAAGHHQDRATTQNAGDHTEEAGL